MKKFYLLIFFIHQFALTNAFADENHATQQVPVVESYRVEVAFLNSLLYSQEYMRYFFADNDSDIRPMPANVVIVHGEFNVWNGTHLVTSLSIPTREETVLKKDNKNWVYYYPKTMLLGVDTSVWSHPLKDSLPIELRLGGGLNTHLGKKFGEIFPAVTARFRIAISQSAGLQFGIGYIGNIERGAWMIPFGFSYRL